MRVENGEVPVAEIGRIGLITGCMDPVVSALHTATSSLS